MRFEELEISEPILRALKEEQYETPTPIQAEAIPHILERKDVMGSAQTGTGKTAAFTLPMLQKIAAQAGGGRRHIKALVLAPTRELAAQVEDSVRTYGRHLKLRSLSVCGGAGIGPQIRQMNSGVDILVATPGRLMDHIEEQGYTQTQAAEAFGIDQPRVSLLMNGRISKFTIDYLINMCEEAGVNWDINREEAYAGSSES